MRTLLQRPAVDSPAALDVGGLKRLLTWPLVLQGLGAALWLMLVTWRLGSVPGMSMDEAWFILSARGQWPPVNPLSGMTEYTGAFPVLLLRLFGTESGLLVLRGASVVANGAMLVMIGQLLAQLHPRRVLAGWALPLVATCPVWLVPLRTGIEVTMFTAPLTVLGLYAFTHRGRRWAFAGGLAWGLLIYNHLLGLWAVLALGAAWVLVQRRLPPIAWRAALAGLGAGLLPRALSLTLYESQQIAGLMEHHPLSESLADLRWMPQALWDTLLGRNVYRRYVGHVAAPIWPYWLVALAFVLPWLRQPRATPRPAAFVIVAVALYCLLTALGAPYLVDRYLVLAGVGVSAGLVLLGAAAAERSRRWGLAMRGAAALLVAGNVYFTLGNFHLPWYRRDLVVSSFRPKPGSPPIGSWHFLPKDELERALRAIEPAPEQVIADASLNRPLRVLLDDTPIVVVSRGEADKRRRSVYVDYLLPRKPARYCIRVRNGNMCFASPHVVDTHFILYR